MTDHFPDHAAWQRCGEVCDTMIAMGLHQGNNVNAETPFFLAQMRKKIFVSAYGHDKLVATFLGRPPRLSHRYCRMEVPLDLSDEQLFLEGAELEAAIAQLDSNGWNTTGTINRTTWRRAWFEYCRIREDILEIALGTGEDDISHQVSQIRMKLDRLYNSNPEFMRLTPEQVLGSSENYLKFASSWKQSEMTMRQVNAIFTVMIQVGIIHTEWLLQRALINRKRADSKDLIPISKRMLAITLLSYAKRDYFRDFQGDVGYAVNTTCVPSVIIHY